MEVEDVTKVAVLGAGNMGHGIAEVVAIAGFTVVMRDITEELVKKGYEGIVWAADNGAEVVNMSWGGGGQSNYGTSTNMNNFAT